MSPLYLYNGQLLVSNNALAAGANCCCDKCMVCYCFCDTNKCSSPEAIPGQKYFLVTFTVPEIFDLPVKVTAVGGVDDVFVLDGDGSVFGQDPAPNTGTGAHAFNYEWIQNDRTFTIEALDTRASCVGINYTLCIMPINSNPIELCEPLIILSNNNNCYEFGVVDSCCNGAVEWRIWEEGYEFGYPEPYPNGPVINNVLVDIPCCWTPNVYPYPGYMKLQVRCDKSSPNNNNSWKTIDEWVTENGEPTKCFETTYDNPCCSGVLSTNCNESSSSSS